MSTETLHDPAAEIVYPESDGQPMAENTLQWDWIVRIKEGLEALFRDDPGVFIAGDLLWYPVEGHPAICAAPDAMIVFGRPKGYRGSYLQWREGNLAPQVVFEVLSPTNRPAEMERKLRFYEQYGPEEYYLYDPDNNTLAGWLRDGVALRRIAEPDGWMSPRLGVRFELGPDELRIVAPDGKPLLSYVELARERDEATRQQQEFARRLDTERQRAERLAARLRELGVDPEG